MIVPLDPASLAPTHTCGVSRLLCPCKIGIGGSEKRYRLNCLGRRVYSEYLARKTKTMGRKWWSCVLPPESVIPKMNIEYCNSPKQDVTSQKSIIIGRLSDGLHYEELAQEPIQMGSNFTNFQEDPMVDKLRTQLGVIHPLPSPPINRSIAGLFVFFFFFGVVFDKLWTFRKRNNSTQKARTATWPQVPTSFSLFLETDLQRKESVEWVNMVLGKLWKVYREGLENWITGLLQPVIDNLKKPDYVQRVEIKQFSLGEEPLSVRNVERRTSRRANDLQYQIGLRYTGGARMLLSLSLNFGVVPIIVPVGVRDFDIDGELWVKLRLIPSEPWVGAVSWAFVSLPKIKFELSPFRLFNIMVLSMFLTKLLTEDLPRLFVRPKKIVLDFQKGKALGPVPHDFRSGEIQEGNRDFVGELSVTLVDARKLAYFFFGKTDPYVVLSLGDQEIRSKKNSQTTVIGPPGEPIWNQDFHMLVTNPIKQRLYVQVRDSYGFADFTIGTGEVDLGSLQDTVPTDRIIALQGRWGLFRKGSFGEILLRLTYKAYVEDEDDGTEMEFVESDTSDDDILDSNETSSSQKASENVSFSGKERESFIDGLAALLVSEEFQGIVSSEARNTKYSEETTNSEPSVSRPGSLNADSEEPTYMGSPTSLEGVSGDPGNALGRPFFLFFSSFLQLTVAISIALLIESYAVYQQNQHYYGLPLSRVYLCWFLSMWVVRVSSILDMLQFDHIVSSIKYGALSGTGISVCSSWR